MEPSYDRNVVKCPGCKSNINISVGRYPGGRNDSGGWVLKCATCSAEFQVPVKNPDELSSVISGASVVASWDNEIGNKVEVLAKHGLSDTPVQVDRLLIKEFGEPEVFYDLTNRPLYQCSSCKETIDAAAYANLSQKLDLVNGAIGSYLNFFLKGRELALEGESVRGVGAI